MEFIIDGSKPYQASVVNGKNEFLKLSVLQWKNDLFLFLILYPISRLGIRSVRYLGIPIFENENSMRNENEKSFVFRVQTKSALGTNGLTRLYFLYVPEIWSPYFGRTFWHYILRKLFFYDLIFLIAFMGGL